jgi:hypothetical protein
LNSGDANEHKSIKIQDGYHQQWHYAYVSYSHEKSKVVCGIKPNSETDFIVKEFDNIKHHDRDDMTSLTFYSGSSDVT